MIRRLIAWWRRAMGEPDVGDLGRVSERSLELILRADPGRDR